LEEVILLKFIQINPIISTLLPIHAGEQFKPVIKQEQERWRIKKSPKKWGTQLVLVNNLI